MQFYCVGLYLIYYMFVFSLFVSHCYSQIQGNGVVLSTDDFFVKNGFYVYDQQDLSKAHEWNKERGLLVSK